MLYSWKTFLTVTFQIKRGLWKDAENLPLETLFLLLDKVECQNKPKTIDVLQAGKKNEGKREQTRKKQYRTDFVHKHSKLMTFELEMISEYKVGD